LPTKREGDGVRGDMDDLWAHSVNGAGRRHSLVDHLRGTAKLARRFASPFGAGDLAKYLGLVHDVGKAGCAWQQRLPTAERDGTRVGVPHKEPGTWLASGPAGPLAVCVYGHHGGMPAASDLGRALLSAAADVRKEWEETAARVAALVPEVHPGPPGSLLPAWLKSSHATSPTGADMLARMVFSALVDADFLDTEAHFRGDLRPRDDLAIGGLTDEYEERRRSLIRARKPSPADAWREDVYARAVDAASRPRGMYRLASPTGSGKTIAVGGFALHHARAHGLRRVVLAVPFISITEQNADVYRELLDAPGRHVVLEHHSAAGLDDEDEQQGWWRKLAAENWDAPFVVTTTVQLFQSLFDHRPAAMRKLHRLAGSVIVLDEVQALPDRLLLPILSALRLLTERFGATVLLASATQPSYWSLPPFHGLRVHNVITDVAPLYQRFRRVTYHWQLDPEPTLAQIAAQAAVERQVLVVVNTTADSATLHRYLDELRDGDCLHLSTRMASQHRRDVLQQIRQRLDADQPVAVVATQLIEAGVDVDFPVVYRAWAPADSLQQAAGRANRNARLPAGKVIIFRPSDGGQPGDFYYTQALRATETHFGPGRKDPDDPEELDRYYPARYQRENLDSSGDGYEIEKLRRDLDFPAVAAKFRLIEEQTVAVAVRYGDDTALQDLTGIIARLRQPGLQAAGEARNLVRDLRPFLASIPKSLARKALASGYAEPIIGDLLEWREPYNSVRGIDPAELAEFDGAEVHVW
jgi:CRISPR-associated endonuclease/helicase Cas3